MSHRASWLKLLASFFAVAVFVLGAAVPAAVAGRPNPPHNTQLPNGRPFQLIQGMIDGLDVRIDALEAAAPKAGTMWINPLDLTTTSGIVTLVTAPVAAPGLQVTAGAAGADLLQVGLQVPLGFAITAARVCYVPGAGFVSRVALAKNDAAPPFTPTILPTPEVIAASPGAATCETMTLNAPYDPSDPADGGPAYLAIDVSFSAGGTLTIRGIALDLAPIAAP